MPQYAPRDLLLQVAEDLIVKGWQPVWCLQRQTGGFSPVTGTTGYEAPYPTVLPQPATHHRLGFRPPPHIVIIDVDHYDGKHGAYTIDDAEKWLGDLPLTYKVTSRGRDDPSGRYIFRKPVDLDFSDRALAQFADEDGKTHVEILRTGHRYSWAPGDINHKNGATVQCYDELGEPCLLPDVNDPSIPELPERWINYLRNPPVPQGLSTYIKPDGPQWWLAQPDNSLGSDTELAAFAFNMMLSGIPMEEVWEQWFRVSRSDDPGWPWSREDFDRHTRSQAQNKAAETIARQESEPANLLTTEAEREEISRKANEDYERLSHLQLQAIEAQYGFPVATPQEQEPSSLPAQELDIHGELRKTPAYLRQFQNEAVKGLARRDAAALTRPPFKGYIDIMSLGPVPDPSRFHVIGGTPLIVPQTITVMSGHRSSGKTWVAATWSAQELIRNATVTWIDYERQPVLLAEKMRMLLPNADLGKNLHYASDMPPLLAQEIPYQAAPLVVIDSWRGLQNAIAPGTAANDGDAVEQVYLEVLTPLQKAGATIVILDHLPKGGTTTFGSERKESAADYVIVIEQVVPFSRLVSGFSSLTISKDRYGHHAAGDVPGYMWVAGQHEDTVKVSTEGITKFPVRPEFRSWAPQAALTLADTAGMSEKGEREAAILTVVSDNRLNLGPRPLGRLVQETYPDLFDTIDKVTALARRMEKEGKLVKEDGKQGKYDLPVSVNSGNSSLDPKLLEHPET